jgi:hypothetical protein
VTAEPAGQIAWLKTELSANKTNCAGNLAPAAILDREQS